MPPAAASICPACGTATLRRAGPGQATRRVCEHCGVCWQGARTPVAVDTLTCPGCSERVVCESRPTPLVEEMSSVHEIAGGTQVLIRPLLYSDRYELADAYLRLTEQTRRRRFFAAPPELSERDLEYLTNLDYRDHFAWAAFDLDSPGCPGIGVGRYVRDPRHPAQAEVAVTVTDPYQHRGLGTLLLLLLVERAASQGVTALVGYMRWENEEALTGLREAGALVEADEPGIARVEIRIPPAGPVERVPLVRAVLRYFAGAGWAGSAS